MPAWLVTTRGRSTDANPPPDPHPRFRSTAIPAVESHCINLDINKGSSPTFSGIGNKSVRLVQNEITIAGQTAPGDGIGLRDGRILITGDDCVIRHIRVRHGKYGGADGWNPSVN